MPSQKGQLKTKKGFDELQKKVIGPEICTDCGACYITCPFPDVLGYAAEGPQLIDECKWCGICLRVCPRYELNVEELEKMVFGRKKRLEEVFGVHKEIYVVRSTDKEILEKSQDGGLVTTLLTSALTTGIIDGAAISGIASSTPWLPEPILAMKANEILLNAGTRYSYSPNLLAFKEGLSKGLKKIAFVGTPCQIQAVRRIQQSLKKYSRSLAVTIGLFCSESFSYQGLMLTKIQDELGLDFSKITKMNIKGGLILNMTDGEAVKIPLKELKTYVEPKCHYCDDFSAELADISVGGVGLKGWTFTIIRTDLGKEVFNIALQEGLLEVKMRDEFRSAFNLMNKLSTMKRKRKKSRLPSG